MAWPIVIATNGIGIPVTEVPDGPRGGVPYEIATNGFGTPVVFVASGGTPVTGGGVLVDRFYQPEDGGDWVFAAERAREAALLTPSKVVLFPRAGVYDTSRCIIHKDGVIWRGAGPGTVIRNTRAAASNLLHGAFFFGNMHPAAFRYAQQGTGAYLPCHDTADTIAGSQTVTLNSPAQASNYQVGQKVFVRAITEMLVGGFYFPILGQFNVVTAINGGTISLFYPLLDTIAGACLSPIGTTIDPTMTSALGQSTPWSVVRGGSVENMTIDARYPTSSRTGMMGCSFKDLDLLNAQAAFAVNAMVKSTAERIRAGNTFRRAIELKCYSDNAVIDDITATVIGESGAIDRAIDIGEVSQRNRIANARVTIADTVNVNVFAYSDAGRDTVLEDFVIDVKSPSNNFVPMYISPSSYGVPVSGAIIRRGTLLAPATVARHIQIGSAPGEANAPTDYLIDSVTLPQGTTTQSQSIRTNTTGAGAVRNSRFPYAISVASGATAPAQSGNTILP